MTTEQQEREKLLHARAEVNEVLTRYGLIGHFVLCGQLGRSEAVMHLDAPWSGLSMRRVEGGQELRLRSKLADYAGDHEAKQRDLASTLSAVSTMGELLGMVALAMIDASKEFDAEAGAQHTPLKPDPGGVQ